MNQDPLSSCTAHAFTSALRFLHMSEGVDEPLSRLFCYWTTRVLVEQTPPASDSGCIVANVVTALEKYGACLESFWPYDVTKFSEKPPQEAFDDALKRTVVTAHPVTTLRALKLSIAAGFPVPLAFTVAKSVEDGEDGRGSRTWETGSFPLPADDDPANYDGKASGKKGGGKSGTRGGAAESKGGEIEPDHGAGIHIVLAVGYDDATGKVKVQNSWGTEFGDEGFGDLVYAFFGPTQDSDMNSHTAPCMAYDAWTLRAQSDQMSATEPMTVIETVPGDVSVSLAESPSSGLGWSVTRQAAGLTILGSDFTPPAGGGAGHAVGRSGVRHFHLRINDVGTYALAFALSHPWIKGEAPAEIRTFQIVVK
jgi:Chagasin family peptidase inhibitor I42